MQQVIISEEEHIQVIQVINKLLMYSSTPVKRPHFRNLDSSLPRESTE